ncbi:MAG: DUF4340 domain-containing protein [Planctomycetes bacterium]|nr:DUF4340 domain-containing protein [Planctomycetota bacterium]
MGRTTWVLAVLVAALGAVALWVHSRDPLSPARARRPLDVDVEAVTGLEIEGPHGRIALRRGADGWTVEAPFRYKADLYKVAGLVAYLASVRTEQPLVRGETPPEALARAGLSSPDSARFTLVLGARTVCGVVGRPPRIGDQAFMAVEGRRGIVALAARAAAVLFEPPDAFRDPRALPLELPDLIAVALETEGRRIALEQRAPDHWVLVEPAHGPVLPAARERLWRALERLRAVRWLGAVPDPARLGLDPPRRRLHAVASLEEGTREETLWLGESTDGATVVARRAAMDAVFTVDREPVEALFALGPEELRDQVVVRIRPGALAAVEVQAPGRTAVAYAWDGAEWRRPDGTAVPDSEAEALGRLLGMLANYRLERFSEASPEDGAPGLRPPALVLRFRFHGRRGTETVAVGREAEGWIRLRRDEESIAAAIPADVAGPALEPFLR